MDSSPNHMACLLKIESTTPGWKKSLKKLLKTINDVSFMIDKQSKTIYVSGKIDPKIILEKITKAGKEAVIVWSNDGRSKQPENRKDQSTEQCYASGSMNACNGFSNNYQNHCYPPLNYWQPHPLHPHHHILAPPPPYTRQLHPQPPAPAPYKLHQIEPVAKSFPQTPPPPKNFAMGDLQPGCMIIAFPTLMLYNHGVPMEYYGPRKADLLVRYLKKFVAPDVAVLESDSAVEEFVEDAGTFFPVFMGFGLNESLISGLGRKYKKKAWFAVAKDASEDVMVSYNFDKAPALVAKHPTYNEHSVFYGPFEDGFLEEFVKQSFLPLILPINQDTLKLLKDDERKIVLTIVEDETHESLGKVTRALRAAAHANRDLVFGYVGVEQFEEFADSFHADKKTKLPKIVVWDGDEEYDQVTGIETISEEEDHLTQVSRFLEGYREGRTEKKKIKGPSLMGFINSMIGIRSVYIIVFLVAVIMMLRSLGPAEEPAGVRTGTAARERVDQTTSVPEGETSEQTPSDKKED